MKIIKKNRILQYCATAILPFYLTGCMGIYEGGFECPAGTGVGCKSISEVNDMINEGELPKGAQQSHFEFRGNHKCRSCNQKGASDSEHPEIWINPLYLQDMPLEIHETNTENGEDVKGTQRQLLQAVVNKEKGRYGKISA